MGFDMEAEILCTVLSQCVCYCLRLAASSTHFVFVFLLLRSCVLFNGPIRPRCPWTCATETIFGKVSVFNFTDIVPLSIGLGNKLMMKSARISHIPFLMFSFVRAFPLQATALCMVDICLCKTRSCSGMVTISDCEAIIMACCCWTPFYRLQLAKTTTTSSWRSSCPKRSSFRTA